MPERKELWGCAKCRLWESQKLEGTSFDLGIPKEYGIGFMCIYETEEEAKANSPTGQVFLFLEVPDAGP